MNDEQIQEIVDRVIEALQNLAPRDPAWWVAWAAFGSYATLLAAVVAFLIGWLSLRQQKNALATQVAANTSSLEQKREADARSEWWRRTQWALEAATSENPTMYSYGAGMLDLLAKSDLAGTEDKALLDAVWEGTSTEMNDEGIELLIQDALDQENLTEEELASLSSFVGDDPQLPPAPGDIDDPPASRENESSKEDTDG
ncbi:hypothetical protein [Arthrobacter sp. HLT1-20]